MSEKIDSIVKAWALAGGVILVAIVLVTTLNVAAFSLDRVTRLAGTRIPGLPGYEDFVRLGISVVALSFFPYCQLRRGHVNVDLFAQFFPHSVQRLLDRLWLVLTSVLALALAWYMYTGMLEVKSDQIVSPVLGWPEWPFYLPGIVSLLLWAAVAVTQMGPGRPSP